MRAHSTRSVAARRGVTLALTVLAVSGWGAFAYASWSAARTERALQSQITRLVLQPGFARCSACGGGGAVPCRAGAKPSTGLKSWRRLLGGLPRSLGARSRVDAP